MNGVVDASARATGSSTYRRAGGRSMLRRTRVALLAAVALGFPAVAWAQVGGSSSPSSSVGATTTSTVCYQALSDVVLCSPNPPPPGAQIVVRGAPPLSAPGGGCLAVNGSVCSGNGQAINGSDSSGCSTALNDSTASGGDCGQPRATSTTVFIDGVPRQQPAPLAPPAQPSAPRSVALTG